MAYVGDDLFRCPRCGEVKPRDAFPRARNRKHGVYTYCRACDAERRKAKQLERGYRPKARPVVFPGERYGRLVVIEQAEPPAVGPRGGRSVSKSGRYYRVRCDCGTETVVKSSDLKRGNTRSCGCLPGGPHRVIFPGDVFGRLTVVEEVKREGQHGRNYRCRCSCGGETIVPTGSLRRKRAPTRSCGCLRREFFPGLAVAAESAAEAVG